MSSQSNPARVGAEHTVQNRPQTLLHCRSEDREKKVEQMDSNTVAVHCPYIRNQKISCLSKQERCYSHTRIGLPP